MDIKAAIFDLDGTVLENEQVYAKAFSTVLDSLGVQNIPEFPQVGGIGVRNNWIYFKQKYHLKNDISIDKLSNQTQNEYLKHIDQAHVREGFHDFIFDLQNHQVSIALATSNNRDVAIKTITKFAIRTLFSVVVSVDDVEKSKPDPETFKKASELLGVNTNDCVVFEDAQSGVKAAKLLNMKVIGVVNKTAIDLNEADAIIENFVDLNYEKLNLMLK